MKIDSMIQRENFFEILSETVKEYYRKVYQREIVFEYEKKANLEPLIINEKFSFICRPKMPGGLKIFLMAEYNVRNSRIKYIIGKFCVHMVCAFPVLGKCGTAYMTKEAIGRNVFISPQNRSVRFFNYDTMMVDCITKKGFSSHYFLNQKKFREKNSYSFMVPLIESGDNWFREPILKGHALARTTDSQLYEKGLQDTLKSIKQLADDTKQEIQSDEYLKVLRAKVDKLMSDAEERKDIKDFEFLQRVFQRTFDLIQNNPMMVLTVISHGDLQSGNIWVDESGKTLIYDWETVDRRSIWYDVAVLNYSLRRTFGWKDLLEDLNAERILYCDDVKKRTEKEIYIIKNIILIEDLVFYLEDMVELPADWGSDIFNSFVERIKGLLGESLDDGSSK